MQNEKGASKFKGRNMKSKKKLVSYKKDAAATIAAVNI